MRRALWPLAIVFVSATPATLAPSVAKADTPPTVWDLAKDPSASEHWALHVRVTRLLHPASSEEDNPLARTHDLELHCEAALAMLEQADAATSPDAVLRFDLGTVQYELGQMRGRLDLYAKSAETLAAAVAMAPDHPSVTLALEQMVYAYAKLDRPKDELEAWHRYIPRIVDPRSRSVAQMNMGEAEMRLGQVDDALATMHQVLRECTELPNSSSTYVLTLWDLAVALDRSGDARGALDTAARAARETAISSVGMPSRGLSLITQDPAVFFVPEWEKNWYIALGNEALGREETNPAEAAKFYAAAEQYWDRYIKGANTTTTDPDAGKAIGESATAAIKQWLRIAQLRYERAHAAHFAAVARAVRAGASLPQGSPPWGSP